MTLLDAAVHVTALVLAVAGIAKLGDPGPVGRSLAAAGLPSSPLVGRLVGAGEVAVGGAVLVAGGRWSAGALGLWYLGFVVFLLSNRVRGLDVPCGCIGETERPAGAAHLVVDVLAAGAGLSGATFAAPIADAAAWLDEGGVGVLALVGIVASAGAIVGGILRQR
jgi:hypothetical protein